MQPNHTYYTWTLYRAQGVIYTSRTQDWTFNKHTSTQTRTHYYWETQFHTFVGVLKHSVGAESWDLVNLFLLVRVAIGSWGSDVTDRVDAFFLAGNKYKSEQCTVTGVTVIIVWCLTGSHVLFEKILWHRCELFQRAQGLIVLVSLGVEWQWTIWAVTTTVQWTPIPLPLASCSGF